MTVDWVPFVALEGLAMVFGWETLRSRQWTWQQRGALAAGLFYLMVVIVLCFRPTGPETDRSYISINQVPFNLIPLQNFHIDFFENILMTVPAGGFMAIFFRRFRSRTIVGLAVLPGLTIELCQLVSDFCCGLYQVVDIDDVITNWLGVLIGFALTEMVIAILPRHLNRLALA